MAAKINLDLFIPVRLRSTDLLGLQRKNTALFGEHAMCLTCLLFARRRSAFVAMVI